MVAKTVNIVLIDARREGRELVRSLLKDQPLFQISDEFDDVEQALPLILTNRPDLVMVDIGHQNGNGLELVRQLVAQVGDIPLLVFTNEDELLYAERALRAGAQGYVTKSGDSAQILKAIQCVTAGEYFVSAQVEDKILRHIAGQEESDSPDPSDILSNRELEVFMKIAQGLTSREIARLLGLSLKTVETHRAHIRRKLDLKNSRDLIDRAVKWVQRTRTP